MIRLEDVSVVFPGFAVRNISLHIATGEFFALLGPTGAGKSIILEAIAGLVRVTSGRVQVAGREVTHLPPEKRRIGIVYQDYSLFPHLSVIDNIRFGLRYFQQDEKDSEARVERLIGMLDLERIRQRKPLHLSGGEKQRVALARALSVNPSVVLLDEPLSALDPGFREDLRQMLKKLHQELGMTFLMVTHDFEETLCLADRVALIRQGQLEQVGTAEEIFHRPQTPFAAGFVGMKNIFPASMSGERIEFCGLSFPMPSGPLTAFRHAALRPEAISLGIGEDFSSDHLACPGVISRIVNLGFVHEVSVRCGEGEFRTYLDRKNLLQSGFLEGQKVYLGFDPGDLHLF
ncbi:MAG: ABC transporter ATP-binding protein [Syntrophotaleaceae bacterium]